MKIKTQDLVGPALRYAVAIAEGRLGAWIRDPARPGTSILDIWFNDAGVLMVYVKGDVSVRRWWLFIPRKWCPVHVQMLMIPHAEAGPHLHSHPWSVRTIVLAGNCVEARGDGTSVFMGVGGTSLTRFGQFRRIVSTDAVRGVVVLLITGRERGPWGFLVPHREYLESRK